MGRWTPEEGGAPRGVKTKLEALALSDLADGARTEAACRALAASEGFDYDGFFCQGHTLPGTVEALGFLAAHAAKAEGEWRAAVVFVLSQALAWDDTDEVRRRLWSARRALAQAAGIAAPSDDDVLLERIEEAEPTDEVGAELAEVLRAIVTGAEHECALDVDAICDALDDP